MDSNGNDTTQSACWPAKLLLNPQPPSSLFIDKPHMRADERAYGVGAGNAYVTWTRFDLVSNTSQIQIAACPTNLAAGCSPPLTISGDDSQTQFSHIAIRADGVVTITYININFIYTGKQLYYRQIFDIKYVSCTPNGAPAAPTCSSPSLVHTVKTPLAFGGALASNTFRVESYPTHDNRLRNGVFEEFVSWSQCKTDPYLFIGTFLYLTCPDSQVVMTWSATDGAGRASSWAPVSPVNNHLGDQILPWVKTDHSREIVHIAYLSSEQDPFRDRFNVLDSWIPLALHVPDASIFVTSVPSEPSDDPILGPGFIGDYIGLAAKGTGTSSRCTSDPPANSIRGSFMVSQLPGRTIWSAESTTDAAALELSNESKKLRCGFDLRFVLGLNNFCTNRTVEDRAALGTNTGFLLARSQPPGGVFYRAVVFDLRHRQEGCSQFPATGWISGWHGPEHPSRGCHRISRVGLPSQVECLPEWDSL
jgi:hypothetical protein